MASRFWVGGAGAWNTSNTVNWAATSGGAGGATIPTAADDVFFDANSTGTCSLGAGVVCRSLNCTGFAGTISHTAATGVSIGDGTAGASNVALKFSTTMTYTLGSTTTSTITFVSTAATQQTVDFGGKSIGMVTFNGAGGSWQLNSSMVMNTASTLTLTTGSLDTANLSHTWGSLFSSGTATRSLTLGTSTITLVGGSWDMTTATNLTFNSGTSSIVWNPTTATPALAATNQVFYDMSCIRSSGGFNFNGSGTMTFHNFTMDNGVLGGGNRAITVNTTGGLIFNGIFKFYGFSAVNSGYLVSAANGTTRTIALGTTGTTDFSNIDFRDIVITGTAAPVSGTRLGDGGGNSGVTFPASKTMYFIAASGVTSWNSTTNWSLTSGGAAAGTIPLIHDLAIFDANSFSAAGQGVSMNNLRSCGIDASAATNQPIFRFTNPSGGGNTHYGGFIFPTAGSTIDAVGAAGGSTVISFFGRSSYPISLNGATSGANIGYNINAPGGTYTLASDLIMAAANSFTLSIGTFNANNFNMTIGSLSSSGAGTRSLLMGSGTWTLTGVNTIWSTATTTGMTFNAGTSTVVVSDASATAKTFTMGQGSPTFTYHLYNIRITGGGTGVISFSNSGQRNFHSLTINGTATVTFNVGSTSMFDLPITAAAAATLNSSTAGTPAIISVPASQTSWANITRTDITTIYTSTIAVIGQSLASNGSNMVPNPSFETDLTGWVSYSSATITWDTTNPLFGIGCMKIVTNGTGTGGFGFAQGASQAMAGLVTGQTYTQSFFVSGPVGKRVVVYYGNGQLPSGDKATTIVIPSAGYVRYTQNIIYNGLGARFYVMVEDVLNSPQTYFVDGCQLEPGYNASPYSDTTLIGQTNITKGFGKTLYDYGISNLAYGLNLTGSNSVTLPAINPTSLTLAIRFKTTSPTINQELIGRAAGSSDVFEIQPATGQIRFQMIRAAGNINVVTSGFVPDTNEHFAIATFDSTTGSVFVYIDGLLYGSSTGNAAGAPTNTTAWNIGSLGAARFFIGTLRDARMWNRALTTAEVAGVFGGTIPATGLLGQWLASEATGTQVNDTSGSGNNGGYNGAWVTNQGLVKGMGKTLASAATSSAAFIKSIGKTLSHMIIGTTTRKNLILNPNFEIDTANWALGSVNVTFTQDTSTGQVGTASGKFANSGSPSGGNYVLVNPLPLAYPGQTYTFSAWIKQTLSGGSTSFGMKFTNAAGAVIQSNLSVTITGSVATWTRYSVTATAPVGAANIQAMLVGDSAVTPWAVNIDGALLELGSSLGTYFDGSMPGYSWTGTPGASISSQNLTPQQLISRTLAYAATGSIGFVRGIGKALTYAAASSVVLTRQAVRFVVLSMAASATVSVGRFARRSLTLVATGAATAVIATQRKAFVTLSAAATGLVAIVKAFIKINVRINLKQEDTVINLNQNTDSTVVPMTQSSSGEALFLSQTRED